MGIYICKYGKCDPEQPRISKLGKSLEKFGHETTWVVSEGDESPDNVVVVNAGTKRTYYIKATRFLQKKVSEKDIILGYMHIGGVVGASSTLLKKASFVYDYPDLWTGWQYYKTSEDAWKWKIGRQAFHWLEKWMYKKADYVLTASYSQLEFLRDRHGSRGTSEVILNCPDISIFFPKNRDESLKEKLGLEGKTVLIYLGKIVEEYGCDTLLHAFASIVKEEKDSCLLFLGNSNSESFYTKLRDIIKKYGIEENVVFRSGVSNEKVPHYLNIAEIGFVPFKNSFYNQVGSPNKLFEYMACGLGLITSDMREYGHYITNKENGILVKPDDPKAIANATLSLLHDNKLLRRMQKRNLELARDKYNWENQEAKLQSIFQLF